MHCKWVHGYVNEGFPDIHLRNSEPSTHWTAFRVSSQSEARCSEILVSSQKLQTAVHMSQVGVNFEVPGTVTKLSTLWNHMCKTSNHQQRAHKLYVRTRSGPIPATSSCVIDRRKFHLQEGAGEAEEKGKTEGTKEQILIQVFNVSYTKYMELQEHHQ